MQSLKNEPCRLICQVKVNVGRAVGGVGARPSSINDFVLRCLLSDIVMFCLL